MPTANELMRQRIDAFVEELQELIHEIVLERVQAALAAAQPPAPRKSRPASAKRASPPSEKPQQFALPLIEADDAGDTEPPATRPQRPRTKRSGAASTKRPQSLLAESLDEHSKTQAPEPAPQASIHPFVVRRNGERVRRITAK